MRGRGRSEGRKEVKKEGKESKVIVLNTEWNTGRSYENQSEGEIAPNKV